MSVITVHSVTTEGKHTIAAFQDVSISHEMEDPHGLRLSPTYPGAVGSAKYEIRGSDGYVLAEAGTVEGAYLELLQSQAERIAELEREKGRLASKSNSLYCDLEELKERIRIAIGDKEEPEEEGW